MVKRKIKIGWKVQTRWWSCRPKSMNDQNQEQMWGQALIQLWQTKPYKTNCQFQEYEKYDTPKDIWINTKSKKYHPTSLLKESASKAVNYHEQRPLFYHQEKPHKRRHT